MDRKTHCVREVFLLEVDANLHKRCSSGLAEIPRYTFLKLPAGLTLSMWASLCHPSPGDLPSRREGTCRALVTTPSSQHLPALCKEDFVSDYSLNAPGRPVLRLLHWVLSTSMLSLHHALGAWSFCKAALNALRTPVSTLCKREKDTVYWALGLVPLWFSSGSLLPRAKLSTVTATSPMCLLNTWNVAGPNWVVLQVSHTLEFSRLSMKKIKSIPLIIFYINNMLKQQSFGYLPR